VEVQKQLIGQVIRIIKSEAEVIRAVILREAEAAAVQHSLEAAQRAAHEAKAEAERQSQLAASQAAAAQEARAELMRERETSAAAANTVFIFKMFLLVQMEALVERMSSVKADMRSSKLLLARVAEEQLAADQARAEVTRRKN